MYEDKHKQETNTVEIEEQFKQEMQRQEREDIAIKSNKDYINKIQAERIEQILLKKKLEGEITKSEQEELDLFKFKKKHDF